MREGLCYCNHLRFTENGVSNNVITEVLEMCDSHKCLIVTRFSKFSLGMCVLLIVVPTECDVLIVGNIMTIIVHFTIEHQVYYDWKFKEQHAKIRENIAGAKRYSRPRGFNIAGASAPVAPSIPTPM